MRTQRTLRITDTKRMLQHLRNSGMTNSGIALRIGLSKRTILKWWNDTCPTAEHFHSLYLLNESVKTAQKPRSNAPNLLEIKLDRHKRVEWHKECQKNHPEDDVCPTCLDVLTNGLPRIKPVSCEGL